MNSCPSCKEKNEYVYVGFTSISCTNHYCQHFDSSVRPELQTILFNCPCGHIPLEGYVVKMTYSLVSDLKGHFDERVIKSYESCFCPECLRDATQAVDHTGRTVREVISACKQG